MAGKMTKAEEWRQIRGELRYYAALGGLALMAPLSLTAVLWMLPAAQAVDNWEVEGANGVLYVHGSLAVNACRLEMDSVRQDIALGEVTTGRLTKLGDRGTPVQFELRLRDCLNARAASRDERTGMLSWAEDQPAVRVSFKAPGDKDDPHLVKVAGASGFGLRLLDQYGRDARLGSRGAPLWVKPGTDVLTYTIIPERTLSPLRAGAYQARIDFNLSYD
ncbi:fimbrial protein [Serratia ureilytica]|uniref:fimbrial protein n=1 Tax=Serratia ureilytica TaxID=300181 RepID=UPI001F5C7FFC|nr:fimbrial protein [Serratia ureilytica]